MKVDGRLDDEEVRRAIAEYLGRTYGFSKAYPDLALKIEFVIEQEATAGRILKVGARFQGGEIAKRPEGGGT